MGQDIKVKNNNIRNFSIIAHIDHGKSTLADRLLELTGTIDKRKMKEQVLDSMDLERERGITIKMQPVRMVYRPAETQNRDVGIFNNKELNDSNDSKLFSEISRPRKNANAENLNLKIPDSEYILNLIDTPGHVDFAYEVSRSLAAVEGALLVVDATQGIQAQTIANLHFALEQDLTVIPVINKIDMPSADPDRVETEIRKLLGGTDEILRVSAKTGQNVEQILQAVVEKIPPPAGSSSLDTQCLIFDSEYDNYRGVIAYVVVKNGTIKKHDKIFLIGAGKSTEVLDIGVLNPVFSPKNELHTGEIGYVVTGLKELVAVRVGDTIVQSAIKDNKEKVQVLKLPGYKRINPVVFAGIYPKNTEQHEELREALEKINLNDASFSFEPERSDALGPGFRAGFLGLLHLDIIKERISREYSLDIIITTPSVEYKVKTNAKLPATALRNNSDVSENGLISIKRPQDYPDPGTIEYIEEPWVEIEIVTPSEFIGSLLSLMQERRGEYQTTEYLDQTRAILHYKIPLSSILTDFYDKLKGASKGYASLAWEFSTWRKSPIIRLDILIADIKEEALALLIYEPEAQRVGRVIVERLKETLPRQMFEVKIQAAIGGKIMASERISAFRKDVTAKLYGGDVTRKRKLLEKQKKGKKKMMTSGKIDIPSSVYMEILKR